MYAQESRPIPRIAPIGVVNRGAPEAGSRDRPYVSPSARLMSVYDESDARKKHTVIGAVIGGVVGGGLAVAFAPGCATNETQIGPACALGKALAVGVSTVAGVVVGAVGGYFWPVKSGP